MPERFVCRLRLDRSETGRLHFRYGPLVDPSVPPGSFTTCVVNGPRLFLPPEREFSDMNEVFSWFAETPDFSLEFGVDCVDRATPLVECRRTIEDIIPPDAVTVEFRRATEDGDPHPDIVPGNLIAIIRNNWSDAIPNFNMTVAGVDPFFPAAWPGRPDLSPAFVANFGMLQQYVRHLRGAAAKPPPEDFFVSLRTDGYEFARAPGDALARILANA